jgi:hypothetical protein
MEAVCHPLPVRFGQDKRHAEIARPYNGSPLTVRQFVTHDSKVRLGNLNHDPAIGLNSVNGGQDMSGLEGEVEIFCSS